MTPALLPVEKSVLLRRNVGRVPQSSRSKLLRVLTIPVRRWRRMYGRRLSCSSLRVQKAGCPTACPELRRACCGILWAADVPVCPIVRPNRLTRHNPAPRIALGGVPCGVRKPCLRLQGGSMATVLQRQGSTRIPTNHERLCIHICNLDTRL